MKLRMGIPLSILLFSAAYFAFSNGRVLWGWLASMGGVAVLFKVWSASMLPPKTCPNCSRYLKADITLCRGCGHVLE